jgi:hypothetical protein
VSGCPVRPCMSLSVYLSLPDADVICQGGGAFDRRWKSCFFLSSFLSLLFLGFNDMCICIFRGNRGWAMWISRFVPLFFVPVCENALVSGDRGPFLDRVCIPLLLRWWWWWWWWCGVMCTYSLPLRAASGAEKGTMGGFVGHFPKIRKHVLSPAVNHRV